MVRSGTRVSPTTKRRSPAMTAQEQQTRDLDLWLVDKDADGAVKPGPGRT